jgi:hypothetical protein
MSDTTVINRFDPFAILDEARLQRQINSITSDGGGSSALTVTDGTNVVDDVALLTIIGGVVGGASPNATLTISGGGGGGTVELITSGATSGSPYNVLPGDGAALFMKTIGSASYAVVPLAADMASDAPVLFKDINGDAGTNTITINLTGGELCDGDSEVTITNNYGWVRLAPLPGGGAWYQA